MLMSEVATNQDTFRWVPYKLEPPDYLPMEKHYRKKSDACPSSRLPRNTRLQSGVPSFVKHESTLHKSASKARPC